MGEGLWERFAGAASSLGIGLDEEQLRAFGRYLELITFWNRKINLISSRSPEEVVMVHFVDSLTPLALLAGGPQRIVDLGSGQGLPAVPLKIVRRDLSFALVEPFRKKASFLRETVRVLSLPDVAVYRVRGEELAAREEHRGTYDGALSRAAFRLPAFLTLASVFVRPGGWLLAMKGVLGPEERSETEKVIDKIGLITQPPLEVKHPFSPRPRNLFLFKKPN